LPFFIMLEYALSNSAKHNVLKHSGCI
jgi:hypothetical protein